ncbi:helix-turn-helix domain-containing protein [Flavobacterium sp.]|uniref:helix-turn-helix domain-containing protein n=1 Tax=Flavobacterium sp. TaxID=239 RepID=UPI003D6ABD5F
MKFLIYCFIFLASIHVFSQKGNLTNKEYQILQEKVKSMINSNIDSAFIFASRIEQSDIAEQKAFALGSKAYLFQLKTNSLESKRSYDKAFHYLDKMVVPKEKIKMHAFLLNIGGLIDWKKTDYSKALMKYQQGKKLSESILDYSQVLKFNNNIALINGDVENFKSAIAASRESDRMIDKIKNTYTDEQLLRDKGNTYSNLGNFYEKYYYKNKENRIFLDSAEYFYKRTILYSKGFDDRKISALSNLGNVYYEKKEYKRAEKMYHDLLLLTKESGYVSRYYSVNFNLGRLYFYTKKYDDALTCFKKVDSIYNLTKTEESGFIDDSHYYQAKIYDLYKDPEKSYYHSKLYLDAFEKNETKFNKESMEVNYSIGIKNIKKEIIAIQRKNENAIFLKRGLILFVVIGFVVLLFVLFRNVKRRKTVEEKINLLIAEHKTNMELKDVPSEAVKALHQDKVSLLSIDEEKENEILKKLILLEKKLQYLNPDFTQQAVAKKIKTNTTYLSYVVNKRFGKTFSEYVNELKMNYVINEMISNPTFRKYSTQAMAESVGYKNAVSFTKTFSKRTGVTPVQFIKKLESQDDNS